MSEGIEIRHGCQFISSLVRALGKLPGGLGRFLPCQVGTHLSRLRHVLGWNQCSHDLTSRPLESCHHRCFSAVCGVLGYPKGSAADPSPPSPLPLLPQTHTPHHTTPHHTTTTTTTITRFEQVALPLLLCILLLVEPMAARDGADGGTGSARRRRERRLRSWLRHEQIEAVLAHHFLGKVGTASGVLRNQKSATRPGNGE